MLINDTAACKGSITASTRTSKLVRPVRSPLRKVARTFAELAWAASWHTGTSVVRSARQARVAHQIQRERRALGHLDAHLLEDIGVSAEDAAREATRGWMDPPASR